MPELIESGFRAPAPGDVVMVVRKMRDKDTNRPFDWKFFMVVSEEEDWGDEIRGYVVGSDKLKDKVLRLDIDDERNTIHYLPMEEWPDGVHAFRMALIMKGRIENL